MEYYREKPLKVRLVQIYFLSFIMYMVAVLPFFIERGMPFFYYGDYNVQQIPFYTVAHRAIRSGNLFYLWNVDFGSSLVGGFSFYLLGSPFFWLTIPFPEKFIPYMMPYLMALKYSVCAVTAYAYIRRKVIRDDSAFIGALLYAFSGFNACNIVFNHFTDAVAFFPLFLLSFDRLMELDHHKDLWFFRPAGKRFIFFVLMTSLMAVINYYFFFGEVLFLILYFVICYIPGNNIRTVLRMFMRALLGGLLGVLIPAFYVLQAVLGVSGNSRISNILLGYDLVSYESMNMLWDILKSMVMIPDIIGKGTVFYTASVKNASLAVFLPLFGLSGVIAYFYMKKKSVYKRLILVCLIFAFIPGLNALFSLLNENYYARWFYMPILIMSLMTAKVVERGASKELKKGCLITCGLFLLVLGISILPSYNDYHKIKYMALIENDKIFWRDIIGTSIILLMLIVSIFLVPKCIRKIPNLFGKTIELKRPIMRLEILLIMTAISSVVSLHIVLKNGSGLITDYGKEQWEKQMLNSSPTLDDEEDYFRTETDNTATNYDMYWGYGSLHSFISTIPAQTFDFLKGTLDIERTVETRIPEFCLGIRAILSNKYYLENSLINDDAMFKSGNGIPGFMFTSSQNGIDVYRNMNYIPMGFTYDYYIKESVWESIEDIEIKDRLLSVALILPDKEAEKYEGIINELPESYYKEAMPIEVFEKNCDDRRQSACQKFETNTRGFYAMTSNLSSDKIMFFSVPNMKGFTFDIEDKRAEIINADYGMIAIKVPAGVHLIRAQYLPAGFIPGLVLSIIGLVLFAAYNIFCRFYKNR
ncbi:YfhO family protein [Butyrivibrio sp. INlla16]|uniref:YfhO family protein n=1 Tax=Butyrivibrio sp. INlla16 TaxID=1520807 RepID=UPI00088F5DEB|nr:YfhO family protein [Butyrivibrio sp. INlla16]SDB16928.1 membrane protein YfhO [Butyrivibrio sp. INlla16]